MKTVAAISFRNDHSLSMDVEDVSRIEIGRPVELDDGSWCAELLVRSAQGVVAIQLQADTADKLKVCADADY